MRTAAPSKSSMACIREPTSVSACPYFPSLIRPGRRRMRHKLIVSAVLASLVTGCSSTQPLARQRNPQALPSIDRNATEAGLIAAYLEICLKVAQGTPADQALILANASNEYSAAPTPSRVLRYAMVLSTPGHAGTDPVVAQ